MPVRAPRHPALRDVVEVLWAAGPRRGVPSEDEWMLPTGRVHLAVRPCGRPIDVEGVRFHGATVAAPRTRAYLRDTPGGSESVGAVLRPGAASAVLGVPVGALGGGHVALADVWGDRARVLADRLAAAPVEARTQALEAALVGALERERIDAAMARAARRLERGAPVAAVAVEVGLGERRLRTRFLAASGLAPRAYARVRRLQRVLADAGAAPWAELAALHGYCDRAHLCREFRALTGLTPTRYRPLPGARNHVPRFRNVQDGERAR